MNYSDRVEVYKALWYKLGTYHQVAASIEELSELVVELSKLFQEELNTPRLLDELADAKIMIEQLELIFVKDKLGHQELVSRKIDQAYDKYL